MPFNTTHGPAAGLALPRAHAARTGAHDDALALASFCLLAALLTIWSYLHSAAPINTGDYWRIARSLFITVGHGVPLAEHYPIEPVGALKHLVPVSSMGILAMVLTGLHVLFGQTQFHTATLFLALNLIFWSGGLLVIARSGATARIVATLAMLTGYLGCAYFFKSLYEDAMVFALGPWVFLGLREALRHERYAIFIGATLLLVFAKVQMVFALPPIAALLLARGRGRWLPLYLLLIVLGFSKAATLADVNAYNRLYNGIGWTLQGVTDWPARDFFARRGYFYEHGAELQARSEAIARTLPAGGSGAPDLLGTSYWPTGLALQTAAEARGDRADWTQTIASGRPLQLAGFLASHPVIALDWARTAWTLFLRSDYELRYLRPDHQPDPAQPWLARADVAAGAPLVPALMLALSAVALVAALRPGQRGIGLGYAWLFLVAPLFVAFGDGFFEYEKHLLPLLMLSIVLGSHLACELLAPAPASVSPRASASRPRFAWWRGRAPRRPTASSAAPASATSDAPRP